MMMRLIPPEPQPENKPIDLDPTRPLLIVCEGECNPQLRAWDDAVRKSQRNGINAAGAQLPDIVAGKLVHALHQFIGDTKSSLRSDVCGRHQYQCSRCRHVRTVGMYRIGGWLETDLLEEVQTA